MSHVSRKARRLWREMTGQSDWRPWLERRRKSRLLNAALALLIVVALAFLVSCTPRPVVRPPPAPPPAVDLGRCDLGKVPTRARFATTRTGCPEPLTCYAPADETSLLNELEARRTFDARVAACLAPDEPPEFSAQVAPAP